MAQTLDPKLQRFLANVVNAKHRELLEMLTEDAVIEFPYHLPTTPTRLGGKQEIVSFFSGFGDFLVLDATHLIAAHQTADPQVAILEYEGTGTATQTGKPYQQTYITVLTFRDEQISHWKDYWNPLSVLAATGALGSSAS